MAAALGCGAQASVLAPILEINEHFLTAGWIESQARRWKCVCEESDPRRVRNCPQGVLTWRPVSRPLGNAAPLERSHGSADASHG